MRFTVTLPLIAAAIGTLAAPLESGESAVQDIRRGAHYFECLDYKTEEGNIEHIFHSADLRRADPPKIDDCYSTLSRKNETVHPIIVSAHLNKNCECSFYEAEPCYNPVTWVGWEGNNFIPTNKPFRYYSCKTISK